ncbi:hypothetical protein [Caballeronia sp. LZ035]|uniref:hypothetical protein n=1 Tax=Caballeronia sp. LZ035 TaxID=3038568 RepID=UPI0028620D35|nr:hypothetical protein [Caballeronia sp. LZ035]MDR5757870.1 hypothetical protein [Caballeronia sp. LZ035]
MMNDLPPPVIHPAPRKLPLVAQVVSGILTLLVIVLIVLAIVAASWAILYLIHTAP